MARNRQETTNVSGMYFGPRVVVTIGASPYLLTNNESWPVAVFVAAGAVSLIEFSRDEITFDNAGMIGGQFRLNPGDSLRITYTVTPPDVVYCVM